jgi:glycerol-3-phosphate dehydrogenase
MSSSPLPAQSSIPAAAAGDIYDVAVIGAGVVGCAMARRFTLEGARIIVIDKAADILEGASKGNSAILHTGFDAPEGSLELDCIKRGYREFADIRDSLGLPVLEAGALVVAWSGEQEAALDRVVARARANGIAGVRRIDRQELIRAEPHLAEGARAAVQVPGEHVIDPWTSPLSYLAQALDNGAALSLGSEVTGGRFDGGTWRLETGPGGAVACRQVINCAGLYGDRIDRAVLGAAGFEIRPRKGQFVVFDKAAAGFVKAIILPVPTPETKGIVICRTIFGNVLVGPTAEDQVSREDTAVERATLEALIAEAARKIPALAGMPVTAVYAGLRPASENKDYRIIARPERCWITAGGIRSTGLTAALGIAAHVFDLYSGGGRQHQPLSEPRIPSLPVLAEAGLRDWQRPGHGGIVCHCELVTEREVRRALQGPLAARSMGGLKRRTRAGMGRCQGFYCAARLAELAHGTLDEPLTAEMAHG